MMRIITIAAFILTTSLSGCLGTDGNPQKDRESNTMKNKLESELSSGPENGRIQSRLKWEKSPYLLQHADNPVDWFPWSDGAFERAQKEDKPIFLSIGYSSCHWCHVMEQESFRNPKVAQILNEFFVAIIVDREERPDIDSLYMTISYIMTGKGGWPLTIIMTPDKKPFFAGSYIPRENRYGLVGMLELLPHINDLWQSRRADILSLSDEVTAALRKTSKEEPGEYLDGSVIFSAWEQYNNIFDETNGGFGTAPKFPSPHNLFFLLRYWRRTGEQKALKMVEKTLQAMRRGGIYDHLGYGFHRYATDAEWKVPHFEKMLYDQALMAMAYTEAYQATGKTEYRKTAEEIFEYVLREMTDPGGGFYSALDADSEGEEGNYYLWTQTEIEKALEPDDAEIFKKVYNIVPEGNFADPRNILYLQEPLVYIASKLQLDERNLEDRMEKARQRLLVFREEREQPFKDDKILTNWNGLMIAALAKAAGAFRRQDYETAARRALDFLNDRMRQADGRLWHRYRDGEAAINGMAADYSFLIWGALELYETTSDVDLLKLALELNSTLIEDFWDTEYGGVYTSAVNVEKLLIRQKEVYDGMIPSANSVTLLNLLRLARITGDTNLEQMSYRIVQAFSKKIIQAPAGFSYFLGALDFGLGPTYEVVIVGQKDAGDTQELLQAIRENFIPNKVVVFKPSGQESPEITELSGYIAPMASLDGKATAYVCSNFVCELPTTDKDRMLDLMNAN